MPPAEPAPDPPPDAELVDDAHGLVLRRVVVGPLRTNTWIVHAIGSKAALIVDPGAEPGRLLDALDGLRPAAIVLTHAHFDHVLAVPDLVAAIGAPVLAHQQDRPVWPHEVDTLSRTGHFDAGTATEDLLAAGCGLHPDPGRPVWDGRVDRWVHDGDVLPVGPVTVRVLHTPGHTPGGVSLAMPGHLLTGDTLFPGGPGLTGWPLSDFPQIMTSVRRLLGHPAGTLIHPGHGPDTTVAREQPSVPAWQRRGW